jgi:hypothetical protein
MATLMELAYSVAIAVAAGIAVVAIIGWIEGVPPPPWHLPGGDKLEEIKKIGRDGWPL